ncbi:MAG: hypothetical protein ACRDD9_09360 [Shewanella sp.]
MAESLVKLQKIKGLCSVVDTPNSIASVTRREAIHGGSAMISISSKVTSAIEFGLANLGVIFWENTVKTLWKTNLSP